MNHAARGVSPGCEENQPRFGSARAGYAKGAIRLEVFGARLSHIGRCDRGAETEAGEGKRK
jgi:hypothetical protein